MKKWLQYSLLSLITGSYFLTHAAYANTQTASEEIANGIAGTSIDRSENAMISEEAEAMSTLTEISTVQHLSSTEQQARAAQANRLYDTAERHRRLGEQTKALASYQSALFIFEVLAASSEAGEAQESFKIAANFVRSRISELRDVASQVE